MKRRVLAAGAIGTSLVLSGCGGGGGGAAGGGDGGGATDNPPVISGLTYSPVRAYPTPTKTSEVVSGSISVVDADGDATYVRVTLDDSSELTFPISGGASSETVVDVSAEISLLATPGPHTFLVEAVDARNNVSNTVSGTFTVGAWMAGVRGGYVLTASGFELTNFYTVPSYPCTPLELGVYEPILAPTNCPTVTSFDVLTPTDRTVHMSRVVVGPGLCGGTPQIPTIDLSYGSAGWYFSDDLYGDYVISFSNSGTFKIEEGGGYCEMP